jgi:predicted RNA binding protein YcfA (HicA-like mRNA interferase family)
MSKKDKLLSKARNNPDGLRFEQFETLLQQCGWTFEHQKGSHRIWCSLKGTCMPIQAKGANAKGYQVKQFLTIYDLEQSDGI